MFETNKNFLFIYQCFLICYLQLVDNTKIHFLKTWSKLLLKGEDIFLVNFWNSQKMGKLTHYRVAKKPRILEKTRISKIKKMYWNFEKNSILTGENLEF